MSNHFDVVDSLERELAEYCGSREAVVTTSCTVAIQMALMWYASIPAKRSEHVSIPRLTYVGVAHSVVNSGHKIQFRDEDWQGGYRLLPYPVTDNARWMYRGMHTKGNIETISMHWSKHCAVGSGGAIVLDDPIMADWLRRVRFDGRQIGVAPRDDTFDVPGIHAYMSPMTAAEARTRLALMPDKTDYLPRSDYADLSLSPYFREHQIGATKAA